MNNSYAWLVVHGARCVCEGWLTQQISVHFGQRRAPLNLSPDAVTSITICTPHRRDRQS